MSRSEWVVVLFLLSAAVGAIAFAVLGIRNATADMRREGDCRRRGWSDYDRLAEACYRRTYEATEASK